jgi:5-methyltetrahydrofolate--homocysteine methyltransferase
MDSLLEQIARCVERGKIDAASPFPADMAGEVGATDLTNRALEQGLDAETILNRGLIAGMQRIGLKFRDGEVFVPDVLLAARAMNAAAALLEPHFQAGKRRFKGTLVIGTVAGDLHDIGKNLAAMIIAGTGWNIVDLGVDASSEKFLKAIEENQGCAVGLSALLTTTMVNMEKIVREIKARRPETKVLVGGAPLNREFAERIGADCYCPDPQRGAEYLAEQVASGV